MKRVLGRSGIEVSALGMGCWAIGGPWRMVNPATGAAYESGWGPVDDGESIRAIHAALDNGITFFDTAANYGAGHSEVVLGEALKDRRDRAVIATKFGHIVDEADKTVHGDDARVLENIRADVENSLRRLGTDVIDLYQFHEGEYDPVKAVEVREELENLVDEGKIRWYGWSTDLPDRARVFADGPHCTSIQFRLNLLHDDPEMRGILTAAGLAGINKDPLNKGILTGKFRSPTGFPADDLRSRIDFSEDWVVKRLQLVEDLRPVLTDGGRTMAQGALAYIWAVDPNLIPIPGIRTPAQAAENAGAMRYGPLSADQKAEVDRIVSAAA